MALWTPANLAVKPRVWLDPSDAGAVTLDGSSKVSQLLDKSGNSFHATQPTAAHRPALTTAAFGGRQALNTLGGLSLHIPDGIGITPTSAKEVFAMSAAAVSETSNSKGAIVTLHANLGGGAADYGKRLTLRNDGGTFRCEFNGGFHQTNDPLNGGAGDIVNARHSAGALLNQIKMAANAQPPESGYTGAQTDAVNAVDTLHTIGLRDRSFAGTAGIGGYVGEVLIFLYELSTSEREHVEGYLAHRWGTTANLPAAHPYKTTAPQTVAAPLTAAALRSQPTVGRPALRAKSRLTSNAVRSQPTVSRPILRALSKLTAPVLRSASAVSAPGLRAVARLAAPAVRAAPKVSAPAIRVSTRLAAPAVTAASRVSRPALRVVTRLGAAAVKAQPILSRPSLFIVGALRALPLMASSVVSAPVLRARTRLAAGQVTATPRLSRPILRALARLSASAVTATPRMGRPVLRAVTRLSAGAVRAGSTVSRPALRAVARLSAAAVTARATVSAPILRTVTRIGASPLIAGVALSLPRVLSGFQLPPSPRVLALRAVSRVLTLRSAPRVLTLRASSRSIALETIMLQWPNKDPDDILDYAIDWTEQLAGDTIATVAWTVPEGLTLDRSSFAGGVTVAWLSGGSAGRIYQVTCRITTTAGRRMDCTPRLQVLER